MALIHSEKFAGLALSAEANDPARKGQRASRGVRFGDYGRYAIYAVHTRFDAVEWVVADADVIDEVTGGPGWIRQEATCADALRSMEGTA